MATPDQLKILVKNPEWVFCKDLNNSKERIDSSKSFEEILKYIWTGDKPAWINDARKFPPPKVDTAGLLGLLENTSHKDSSSYKKDYFNITAVISWWYLAMWTYKDRIPSGGYKGKKINSIFATEPSDILSTIGTAKAIFGKENLHTYNTPMPLFKPGRDPSTGKFLGAQYYYIKKAANTKEWYMANTTQLLLPVFRADPNQKGPGNAEPSKNAHAIPFSFTENPNTTKSLTGGWRSREIITPPWLSKQTFLSTGDNCGGGGAGRFQNYVPMAYMTEQQNKIQWWNSKEEYGGTSPTWGVYRDEEKERGQSSPAVRQTWYTNYAPDATRWSCFFPKNHVGQRHQPPPMTELPKSWSSTAMGPSRRNTMWLRGHRHEVTSVNNRIGGKSFDTTPWWLGSQGLPIGAVDYAWGHPDTWKRMAVFWENADERPYNSVYNKGKNIPLVWTPPSGEGACWTPGLQRTFKLTWIDDSNNPKNQGVAQFYQLGTNECGQEDTFDGKPSMMRWEDTILKLFNGHTPHAGIPGYKDAMPPKKPVSNWQYSWWNLRRKGGTGRIPRLVVNPKGGGSLHWWKGLLRRNEAWAEFFYTLDRKKNKGIGCGLCLEPLVGLGIASRFGKYGGLHNASSAAPRPPGKVGSVWTLTSWVIEMFKSFLPAHPKKPALVSDEFFKIFATDQLQDDEKAFLIYKFLVAVIYRIIGYGVDIKKKLNDLKKKNQKRDKGSKQGDPKKDDFTDAAKQQILINAQCFMLNTIDKFAQKHQPFSGGIYDSYTSTRINGNCDNILNLIGKKDEAAYTFLNIKPSDLALLQPRIRLFKHRRTRNKDGKEIVKQQKIEVPGPFETALNPSTVNQILSQRSGRLLGSGIKEVSMSEAHGNESFKRANYITVDITFHFNKLEEIFLNWPVFAKDPEGAPIKNKVSYPFGTSPGYKKPDIPASVAELVFPIETNITDVTAKGFQDLNRPGFNVTLEWGWAIPDTTKFGGTPAQQKILKDLVEKAQYRTLILTPQTSEFNIRENGTIELKVTYYGLSQHLFNDKQNQLFPSLMDFEAGVFSLKKGSFANKQKLEKAIKALKAARAKARQVKSQNPSNQLLIVEAENKAKAILQKIQDSKLGFFLERNIAGLFKTLMDPNVYHRIQIPKAFLGISDDRTVLKWSPYRDMSIFKNFTIQKNSPFGKNFQPRKGASSGNAFFDQARAASAAGAFIGMAKKGTNKKEGANLRQEALKRLRQGTKNTVVAAGPGVDLQTIDFIYFGDLVEKVIQYSFEANLLDSSKSSAKGTKKYILDRINLVLGSMNVPLLYQSSKNKGIVGVTQTINIADIPIVVQFASEFIIDFLVRPGEYEVPYVQFLITFFRWFVQQYMARICYADIKEFAAMNPEVFYFDLYATKKGDYLGATMKDKWKLPVTNRASFQRTKTQLRQTMEDYEKIIKAKDLSPNPSFHYCYLGVQTLNTRQKPDVELDKKEGIHHFYIGRDVGIVKKIEFKSREIQGRAEAVWSVVGTDLDKAMFMIPKIYDVTVTMVGNNLFKTGQTFFVNPTLGSQLSKAAAGNLDLIKNTGLGGYYYISKNTTVIRAGKYETILEGIKVGLAVNDSQVKVSSPVQIKPAKKEKKPPIKAEGIGNWIYDNL